MALSVQVCVRTRVVRSSDLKQSPEHLNCWEFGSEQLSEHPTMFGWLVLEQL